MKWMKKAAGWILLALGSVAVLTIMVLVIIGLFANRIQFAQSNHEERESKRIQEVLDARLLPPKPKVQTVQWDDNYTEGQVVWEDDIDRKGVVHFSLDDSDTIEFNPNDLNSYPLNEHLTYFQDEILKDIETN